MNKRSSGESDMLENARHGSCQLVRAKLRNERGQRRGGLYAVLYGLAMVTRILVGQTPRTLFHPGHGAVSRSRLEKIQENVVKEDTGSQIMNFTRIFKFSGYHSF